MAKRSKRKQRADEGGFFDDLSPHTKQAIGAIGFVVLGVFFVLSALDKAGIAGGVTHEALTALFGFGFVLAPVICALYVYVLLKPREDEHVSTSKVLGVGLFFIAALGLISLVKDDAGGFVGELLLWPLSWLFADVVASIVLSAILITSLFLTFNTGFMALFKRREKEETEDETDALAMPLPPEDSEEGIGNDESEEEEEETPKKSVRERIGLGKTPPAEFAVSSFEGPYAAPPLSLLQKDKGKVNVGDVKGNANIIKRALQKFNIQVEMDEVTIGPSVTRYAIKPAEGVRLEKIVSLQTNLEYALAASPIRIEAPIPGKSLVGIEVPNTVKAMVGLASTLSSPEYTDSPKPLLVALGKDISGKAHFADIGKMPHGLIAGTTGSGKSVAIHNLVVSLLFRNSPEQLRFIMIDPKRIELTLYNGIPHLLTPVITDAKKAILSLKWAIKEMERRLDILAEEKVQNLAAYHEEVYRPAKAEAEKNDRNDEDEEDEMPEPLPYIVVIIDELADLMSTYPRELEASIVRLAQMSRATGIHLILSTQRPSVNVITGTIKANVPTRIALQVASQIDSRTILDQAGAEKLLGKGDMLFLSAEHPKPTRLQSAFISPGEMKKVVDYLKKQTDAHSLDAIDLSGDTQSGNADAFFAAGVDDEEEDDLYEDAKAAVIEAGKASTSYIQRKLRIGYSRAARLMDILEERGVIGPADGARPREILAGRENEDDEDEENVT